jgi:hypothetical protein
VAGGVYELERIVRSVGISVKVLWVARVGHDSIRLQEPADDRIIPPRAVVVQIDAGLDALAGEAEDGFLGTAIVAVQAEGVVAQVGDANAAGIGRDVG